MTKNEVIETMAKLVQHIRREQEIREQLMELEFCADDAAALRRALEQQESYMRQIEDLRQEQMLPLIEQTLAFIARRRDELRGPATAAA